MRMLCWMCGYTKLDRIRNVMIRSKVRVASIKDEIRDARLKWFDHIRQRNMDAPLRSCERIMPLEGKGGRG